MVRKFYYKFNIIAVYRTGLTYYEDDRRIGPVCRTIKFISTDDYDELRKLVDELKNEWWTYDVVFFNANTGELAVMNDKEKKLDSCGQYTFDGFTIYKHWSYN